MNFMISCVQTFAHTFVAFAIYPFPTSKEQDVLKQLAGWTHKFFTTYISTFQIEDCKVEHQKDGKQKVKRLFKLFQTTELKNVTQESVAPASWR